MHPTGKAILKLGVKSQGQGHETTFAQIVAEELGIPASDVRCAKATPTTHHSASAPTHRARHRSVAPPPPWWRARLRDKGKIIAAHLFEADVADIEFAKGKYNVKGSPDNVKTIQDIAFAAYTNIPDGIEAGLEGVTYYDPPNMTFPFGTTWWWWTSTRAQAR